MKASVFIATSLDGFLARTDGDLAWLPPGGGEEHGYDAFMATVDALVIGRKTFEKVLTFGTWPYGEKPVFVLRSRGVRHIYVVGGITIQRFLQAGLIQRLIITRIPVLISAGISLFGAIQRDIVLSHVGTRQYASGLVQSEYVIGG